MFTELNEVKLEIETHYEQRIGAKQRAVFREVLAEIGRAEKLIGRRFAHPQAGDMAQMRFGRGARIA